MKKIVDLYKSLGLGEHLLPTSTGFTWWDNVYGGNEAVYDREFARKYADYEYYDFMNGETSAESKANLKADVLSILTINQKKYAEMYRVFIVSDQDDPITYNYDMTETTGAQHSETSYGSKSTEYGATSATYGQQTHEYGATSATYGSKETTHGAQTNTKGQQIDTIGEVTDTHSVAPMNSTTPQVESSDVTAQRTNTEGQRIDTTAQYSDTEGSHTDTTLAHTDTDGSHTDTTLAHTDIEGSHKDQYDADSWTLTRKGNIGVQTAGDIMRIHTDFWTNHFKFMSMIFEDINIELLMIGD